MPLRCCSRCRVKTRAQWAPARTPRKRVTPRTVLKVPRRTGRRRTAPTRKKAAPGRKARIRNRSDGSETGLTAQHGSSCGLHGGGSTSPHHALDGDAAPLRHLACDAVELEAVAPIESGCALVP